MDRLMPGCHLAQFLLHALQIFIFILLCANQFLLYLPLLLRPSLLELLLQLLQPFLFQLLPFLLVDQHPCLSCL